MIIDKHISIRRLIPIIWKRLALMALISAAIVVPMELLDAKRYGISMTTPLILGTALSIFLGFRTNSAYERWMSGRRLFGEICQNVRNLALLCARNGEPYTNRLTGLDSNEAPPIMRRLIKRGVAFVHVFGRELKGEAEPVAFDTAAQLLEPADLTRLKASPHPALQLLFLMGRDFREAADEGQFLDGEHFEYVAIQRNLAHLMSQCQLLNNTPFPTHYTFFTDVFVWLLVVLLSLSLPANEVLGYYAIPIVVLIGWTFSMIEGIGDYMDYPWMPNRNVVPVEFLARENEREIRRVALGEDHELSRIQPIEGALY